MKPSDNSMRKLLTAILAASLAGPALAFDLDSDDPISVSADSARLDDGKGIATYTGAVVLVQGKTRLTAERVVLYRSVEGLNRIEANGSPARYQQPVTSGEGETDAKALNITWSAPDKQLTFEREAVIEQNGNVFSGDIIHYDTEQRVVTAEGSEDTGDGPGRVEMIIQPRSSNNSTQ
ncbi:lipopolysaccharide transport periplasmic protein LptA [Marinobacter sp.]|uniref:lipopolysaccharide transport periplasmic protein LptA n=1 Tax=Marinobacter sp. TaxID=50741 RepID=UPI003A8F1208